MIQLLHNGESLGEKSGKFGKLSMIRHIKTIHISTYNKEWCINLPNFLLPDVQKESIHELYLPQNIPAIQYIVVLNN